MASSARVRTLLAVIVVLLLAVLTLASLPGVAARVGQGALVVAMAAVLALLASAAG